ncbi:DMT family transporter [Sphingomonas sp. STIS6.2]|uniref:DMT family transporter n=1 Tax=Sphingomonas sp. STIS6.2 TaxID=1379700 RepID=UPI0004DB551D|nr:DMT family transporter [Sphingomonas sp. STIS6.2]
MPTALTLGLYLITVFAGSCVALQQVLNANLRVQLGSPWWAGFISYFVGMIVMLAIAIPSDGLRSPAGLVGRINGLTWTGGIFGAAFIGIAILMVPRLGAATTLGFIIVGQLAAAVVVDHFGLLGVVQHPISLVRLLGVVLLITGVALVRF